MDRQRESCSPTSQNEIRPSVMIYNLVTGLSACLIFTITMNNTLNSSFFAFALTQFIQCLKLPSYLTRINAWKLKIYVMISLAMVAKHK